MAKLHERVFVESLVELTEEMATLLAKASSRDMGTGISPRTVTKCMYGPIVARIVKREGFDSRDIDRVVDYAERMMKRG
jgi:hypothetical protein